MAAFLARTLVDGKNTFSKVEGELEDFPDHHPITLHSGDPARRVTILLPKMRLVQSAHDPTGLVDSYCEHGLPEHPVTGAKPRWGRSFIRSKYLNVVERTRTVDAATGEVIEGPRTLPRVGCPVCWGNPAPDDMLTPANNPRVNCPDPYEFLG